MKLIWSLFAVVTLLPATCLQAEWNLFTSAETAEGPLAGEEAAVIDAEWDILPVRTTAYTHTESDHIKWAKKNALGTTLKYGKIRSAAADWSRYPVGTKFRIAGQPELYEIDDYGSGLVGKNTIDLYKPSRSAMNAWGAKNVEIEVVEWGSFEKSLKILKPRTRKASHVATMARSIKRKLES